MNTKSSFVINNIANHALNLKRCSAECHTPAESTGRLSGASTPPGTHPRQYLVSRGREYLISPKFVIVVFIIVNSVLTVHIIWRNGWRRNASKCTDFHVTIQNFSRGYVPEPPCWGGATAPLPKPHPLGIPALRTSRASLGASIVPQCLLAVDATVDHRRLCWRQHDDVHQNPQNKFTYTKQIRTVLSLKTWRIRLTWSSFSRQFLAQDNERSGLRQNQ